MPSTVLKRLLSFDETEGLTVPGCLAGVDEVGLGPLAGPVVAAAVIFVRTPPNSLTYLNDSKKVTPERREVLFGEITRHALIGIGVVSEAQIDEINIYQAARRAMRRAVLALTRTPDYMLVDGRAKIDLPLPQKTIIKGDAQSAAIAAASIIAKVYRDAWMTYLDSLYPQYCFKEHKGYGTPKHLKIIREIGPSPVHRRSFAPVEESWKAMTS